MRPVPDEVLHFSENPSIAGFVPHVAATAQQPSPYVWAVDAEQAPTYWFPRDCPRVTAWVGPRTTVDDRERILGPGGGELRRGGGAAHARVQWDPDEQCVTPTHVVSAAGRTIRSRLGHH
jgi:hypothetical protein